MDKLLMIIGLLTAFGALDVLIIAVFLFRSRKAALEERMIREYGPPLELYENGIRYKRKTGFLKG